MIKLAIFVHQQKIFCYSCDEAGNWAHQRIKGEASLDCKPGNAAASSVVQEVLKDQNRRINQQGDLRGVEVHLLYTAADAAAMVDAPSALAQLQCSAWQILRLEPLLERAALVSGVATVQRLDGSEPWLKKALLPILTSTFAYSHTAFEAEETQARLVHEETMESLQADMQARQQQVRQLQAQVQALQLPNVEHLLVYLPAIYRNFWGVVRPDELALMAGILEVPAIASPYIDPSPDTVLMLKRRLLRLPEQSRERILAFCRALPHRLEVRNEMREFLGNSAAY